MAGLPVPLFVLVSVVPRLRTADGAQRASACSRPWGTGTGTDTGVEGARAGPSPAGHTQTRERPLTVTRCRLNSRRAASWSRLGGKRDWVPESSSSVTSLCRRHRGTLSRVRRTWSHGATYRCPKQQAPLLTPPPSFLGTVQGQAASQAQGRALQPRRQAPRCPSLTERVPGVADMQRARGRPEGGSVGLSVDVTDSGACHRARHDGHAGRPLCAGPCSGRRLVGITSRPDPRLT